MRSLEVLFTPAEFAQLKQRQLGDTVCVVFDVLRATSSMLTALACGVVGIVPVEEISEALAYRSKHADALLAGEREGVRIQAGDIRFDLGNSPREFTPAAVGGRTVVMTTTNGTRALRACAHAQKVLVASFLNLQATADFITRTAPTRLLLVCSGTHEEAAYEDVLGAGCLCDLLWQAFAGGGAADSALVARKLWSQEREDLLRAVSQSRNGRRLLGMPELRDDVAFCVQRNIFPFPAELGRDGMVKRHSD